MSVRIQYYDNLRAFACFLVILTHSAMPSINPAFGMYMFFFSLIASPSSELFISISSSLLAPTKLSMLEFYKKRFPKLLFPFLFWSIFMVGYRFFTGEIDEFTAVTRILLFPIRPTEDAYWFVYVICALYLLNPVISPWLKTASKKELQIVLLLWLMNLLMPLVNIITGENLYQINGDYNFILVYMGGYLGYMFIGVYLKKFPIFISNRFYAFTVVLGLATIGLVPFMIGYVAKYSAGNLLNNNLSLTSACFVIAIYIFFKNFNFPAYIEKWMTIIAKYSFGIYLIHILIVREVVWKIMENYRLPHPVIETPFIAIVSLVVCLGAVKALCYLPKSQYIIGA